MVRIYFVGLQPIGLLHAKNSSPTYIMKPWRQLCYKSTTDTYIDTQTKFGEYVSLLEKVPLFWEHVFSAERNKRRPTIAID